MMNSDYLQQEANHGTQSVRHMAHRKGVYGRVVLYPGAPALSDETINSDEEEELSSTAAQTIAATIVKSISQWLTEGRVLASTGLPICASDILILLRQRSTLQQALLDALNSYNIPNAGVDRITLSQHMAVREMLAFAAFMCDASDDMALAAVLTSPLYNLSYDALTLLAAPRAGKTLWSSLQQAQEYASICEELDSFRLLAQKAGPQELFAHLLFSKGAFSRYIAFMGEGVREILQSFLHACARFEESETIDLHLFITWMQGMTTQLKREGNATSAGVRVMTVHGAKGLEAPVVIMAETQHDVSMRQENILPFTYKGLPCMVYLRGKNRKEKMRGIFKTAYETKYNALAQESLRLLYVAMTRACDELHVFNSSAKKTLPSECWYERIKSALQHLGATQSEDGTLLFEMHAQHALQSSALQMQQPIDVAPYRYLLEPVSALPMSNTVIRPSDVHETLFLPEEVLEREGFAVTAQQRLEAQRYGTLIHALLEKQTNQRWDDFMEHMPKLLRTLAPDLEPQKLQHIERDIAVIGQYFEIISLLELPALAEVPISGKAKDGLALSGRIDRLIITSSSVHILDFKTGNKTADARQLQLYQQVVKDIYPKHTVLTSFLYLQPKPLLESVV